MLPVTRSNPRRHKSLRIPSADAEVHEQEAEGAQRETETEIRGPEDTVPRRACRSRRLSGRRSRRSGGGLQRRRGSRVGSGASGHVHLHNGGVGGIFFSSASFQLQILAILISDAFSEGTHTHTKQFVVFSAQGGEAPADTGGRGAEEQEEEEEVPREPCGEQSLPRGSGPLLHSPS